MTSTWPGWLIERLPFGFIGHLTATGHDDEDLIMTGADLRANGRAEDLIAVRNGGRSTVRVDPRPLQPPRVRVIEQA
ncbi:hypothetical protein [Actinoallomurus vinaceus]